MLFSEATEHRQACRPGDTPFPRKRKDLTACSPGGLLFAAQAEGLGPCSPQTPGGVGLGESKAQPSGTSREHEPNGCGESMYETKRGKHPISIMHSCNVDKKVNRQTLETMKAYCGEVNRRRYAGPWNGLQGESGRVSWCRGHTRRTDGFNRERSGRAVHGVSAICIMRVRPCSATFGVLLHIVDLPTAHTIAVPLELSRQYVTCLSIRDSASGWNEAVRQADCLRKRSTARTARTAAQASRQRTGHEDRRHAETSLDNVLVSVDDQCARGRPRHFLECCAGELERDPCAAEAGEDEHEDERERYGHAPRSVIRRRSADRSPPRMPMRRPSQAASPGEHACTGRGGPGRRRG